MVRHLLVLVLVLLDFDLVFVLLLVLLVLLVLVLVLLVLLLVLLVLLVLVLVMLILLLILVLLVLVLVVVLLLVVVLRDPSSPALARPGLSTHDTCLCTHRGVPMRGGPEPLVPAELPARLRRPCALRLDTSNTSTLRQEGWHFSCERGCT